MSELIIRLKRLISPIARKAHCDLRMPLPVWDDSGQAIGVAIECDKKMGPTDCRGQATFALTPEDYADDAKVIAKAELAVSALKQAVLVSIRPKKAEKAA